MGCASLTIGSVVGPACLPSVAYRFLSRVHIDLTLMLIGCDRLSSSVISSLPHKSAKHKNKKKHAVNDKRRTGNISRQPACVRFSSVLYPTVLVLSFYTQLTCRKIQTRGLALPNGRHRRIILFYCTARLRQNITGSNNAIRISSIVLSIRVTTIKRHLSKQTGTVSQTTLNKHRQYIYETCK